MRTKRVYKYEKNVFYDRRTETFKSYLAKGGKRTHLGTFSTKEEAYKAVCDAITAAHGEFARLA